MAEEKGNNPQTEIGKQLTRLIARTEKLVEEGQAVYEALKELKENLPKQKE